MERLLEFMRRNAGWPIGVIGLIAWLALLYYMVGDVL